MTIIEKIKQSVEGATGMPFLYHAAGELNELIARCKSLPVAYSFLIDSGTIDDVNGRYHERVTLAVMFCDKTEFDFNALENEQIIDRMKVKAYKWLQSLRMSNTLRIVSINSTQRLYDNTTDVLTGFAVNITIEDIAGVGECELPDVIFEIKDNGEYPVVGIDKVIVSVPNSLTDLVVTENGKDYLPVDYGAYGFGKVRTEVKKIKPTSISFRHRIDIYSEATAKINIDLVELLDLHNIDYTNISSFASFLAKTQIYVSRNVPKYDIFLDLRFVAPYSTQVTNVADMFYGFGTYTSETYIYRTTNIYIDMRGWDFSNVQKTSFRTIAYNLQTRNGTRVINLLGTKKTDQNIDAYTFTYVKSLVGDTSIDDIINNDLKVLEGHRGNCTISNNAEGLVDRASLRAFINGLADLTGGATNTIKMYYLSLRNLTTEDIAVATEKNWTITTT